MEYMGKRIKMGNDGILVILAIIAIGVMYWPL